MSLFDSFLNNLKAKVDAQTAYKRVVQECIKEVLGVTISEESILSLKDGVLRLGVNPTLKSAINLKQERLLERFKESSLTIRVIQ